MKKVSFSLSILAVGVAMVSCSNDDNTSSNQNVTKAEVIENYADIVYQNYRDAYEDAVDLETAINEFTENPTQDNFNTARLKWKEARETYGTTEAFRFANGPIDDENGPEGLLNAWPLDENFIDYVEGNETAGIINHADLYSELTKDLLIDLNESENEKTISVGYHAIEFLLWGQDLTDPADNLPGQRAYTDYVDGSAASNQDRRREYLNICADLLTDHLTYLVDLWKEGGTYRNTFLALDENTALQNIYLGIVTLAGEELAGERMDVALQNMDQEDEHSCFSDNTHRDIALNLQGVINIYKGRYGTVAGPGLDVLVYQANATAYDDTDEAIDTAVDAVAAILTPFDLAIKGGPTSTEGAKVATAVTSLEALAQQLLAGAAVIGVTVNG
jgi:putative iron-regulated protein